MSEPYVIKCNLMLPPEKLEELRQKWNNQAAEQVIVLPPGFELVKNEEMDEIYKLFKGMTPKMQSVIKEIMEIEQTRGDISKLKGE